VLVDGRVLQCPMLIRSGCFGAGFGEGEPLVAEVGDDLQAVVLFSCERRPAMLTTALSVFVAVGHP
jgi:hypothetical protein